MKKIFAYLLTLVMCFGFTDVLAEDVTVDIEFEKNVQKLSAFGVRVDGDAEDEVIRAEFIKKVLEFLGVDAKLYGTETVFSDVDKNYLYAPEINAGYSFGYMVGYENGKFYPESVVNYNQAIKVIVTALGYEETAILSGGYPNGYLKLADEIGLTDDIKTTDVFNNKILTGLLLNACECVPQKMKITQDGMEIYEDEDVEALFEYHRILKVKGIIDANEITGLMSKSNASEKGYVSINGESVQVGNTNASDYLGKQVLAYIYYPEDEDEGEIKYIETDSKNTVITVKPEDILDDDSEFSYYNFIYYNELGRRKNVKITDNTAIIYNGVAKPGYSKEDLAPEIGEVTLIDSNGDGEIDVIDIFDATKVIVVDYVTKNDTGITITDKFDSKVSYKYDTEYEFYDVELEGNDSSYNVILENMLVLIGENGEHSKTRCFTESFEGKIESLAGEEITVEGKAYKLPESMDKSKFKLNSEGTFWENDGYILGFLKKKSGEFNYGYFVKPYLYDSDSGEETLALLVLTAENEYERILTNERTKYNGSKKETEDALSLFKVQTDAYRDRANYAGVATVNEDVNKDGYIEQVIMYSLDENGEIKELYTQSSREGLRYEGLFWSKWHNNIYSFYQDTWMNKFYQDSETIAFYISNDDIEESYSTLTVVKNGDAIPEEYVHEFYNVTDEENTVDVVVWRKDTSGEGAKAEISGNVPPTIIKEVSTTLNADDEPVKVITGVQNGKNVTLEYNEKMLDDVKAIFESIRPGDIIYYQKDAKGNVVNISKSFDITKKGQYGIGNQNNADDVHSSWNNQTHMERKVTYFPIKKLSNDFVSYTDGNGEKNIQRVDQSAKFYKMTVTGKKVSVEAIEYPDVQNGDEVYCLMRYNLLKAMIVIDVK